MKRLKKTTHPTAAGRPRSFDREAALDIALDLFWQRGYEGVEVREIATAVSIHPPSFYAAFGDKRRLFFEAVDLYEQRYMSGISTAMQTASTVRSAASELFSASIRVFTGAGKGRGCLLLVGAANCTIQNESVSIELARRRSNGEAMIHARVLRGLDEGDLPPETDANALTSLLSTFAAGISMQARQGTPTSNLLKAAELVALSIPAVAPQSGVLAPPLASRRARKA